MIARWLVLLPAVCGAGDAWMRFTLEHTASTSDGIGLLSILPTSNRSYLVQDVRSRGYDRDLHLDGVTLGHSDELRATAEEFAAAGWRHRQIFDRLVAAGARVLTDLHSGCERVRASPARSKLSRWGYRGLYTNAYVQKNQTLVEIPERDRSAPEVVAVEWKEKDDQNHPNAEPTGFHTDGGDADVITLWLPIIREPVEQWPLVWIDPRTLRGCGRPTAATGALPPECRPGHSSDYVRPQGDSVEPRLMYWSDMSLGDWIAWDGARTLHASAEIPGRQQHLPRAAFSALYVCERAAPDSPSADL